MKNIDVSFCPSSLEFDNGDRIDEEKFIPMLINHVKRVYPDYEISIQIGHRQSDEWAKINGKHDDDLRYVIEDFDWTDETIFV